MACKLRVQYPGALCHVQQQAETPMKTVISARPAGVRSPGVAIALLALLTITTVMAQRPLGIDVSSYQGGSINWTDVKNDGISFAYVKAAEGSPAGGFSIKDPDFAINEAGAAAAGIPVGAYYYAHPELDLGTSGADSEAGYFWSVAGNYIKPNGGLTLMPMLDIEQNVTSANPAYTRAALSAWANEWCMDIVNYAAAEGVVVKPVVYTYISYAAGTSGYGPGLNSTVNQWPLWMASPNGENPQIGAPSATSPWSTWTLWQYGQADLPGITTGAVDEDVFNGTAAGLESSLVIVPEPGPSVLLLLGTAIFIGQNAKSRRTNPNAIFSTTC